MTNFETADNKGRETFKQFCNEQKWCKFNREAKKEYAKWDVSYIKDKQQTIGEIKMRDYNSTDFNEWFLQEDKYLALKELQKKIPGSRITYINHFKNNITFIWDLTDMDMTKVTHSMSKLQKNDYTTETVWKKVYHLHHVDAQKYETDETKSIFK